MALRKRGQYWHYRFKFKGHPYEGSTRSSNKERAKRIVSKIKEDLINGLFGLPAPVKYPKFDDMLKEFLAYCKAQHEPKTYVLHEVNSRTLLRWFKGKRLDEISPKLVEKFKEERSREKSAKNKDKTLSPATVNRALTTLKALYNHAIEVHELPLKNPVRKVKFQEEVPKEMKILTRDEQERYLQNASQPLRDVATVMVGTGMRPEEVFKLQGGNVNLEKRTIFIPRGKTAAARRSVPITSSEAAEALKARLALYKDGYLFPAEPKFGLTSKTPHLTTVKNGHNRAVKRAGITGPFVLYDLRHTFATRSLDAGVDLLTMSKILGHSRIDMSLRYVHVLERHKTEAGRRMWAWNEDEKKLIRKKMQRSLLDDEKRRSKARAAEGGQKGGQSFRPRLRKSS